MFLQQAFSARHFKHKALKRNLLPPDFTDKSFNLFSVQPHF